MTMIRFNYTDSYANPSRGSLAFMPHRRHAANETEILPKPFTVPLLNGEVTVDLQPNASTWVWIVTEYFEEHAESFYTTVPDKDGVLEHTELTKINPSSIPAPYNAVEPAWWAEIKATKSVVTQTLVSAGKALESAEKALQEGGQNRDEARKSASDAKAYAKQSTESSYASKDYRDESEEWAIEAERQADRAATGPESAAGRAESARDDAERYRSDTKTYRDEAQTSANNARDDAQSANNSASSASSSANDATNARDTAEQYRDTARQYRDELLNEPEQLVDTVRQYHDDVEEHLQTIKGIGSTVETQHDEVESNLSEVINIRSATEAYRDQAEQYAKESYINSDISDWVYPELEAGWDNIGSPYSETKYRHTPLGLQIIINVERDGADDNSTIFTLDSDHRLPSTYDGRVAVSPFTDRDTLRIETDGRVKMRYSNNNVTTVYLNTIIGS